MKEGDKEKRKNAQEKEERRKEGENNGGKEV